MLNSALSPDSTQTDTEKHEGVSKKDENGSCDFVEKSSKQQNSFKFCKPDTVSFKAYQERARDAHSANKSPSKPKVTVDSQPNKIGSSKSTQRSLEELMGYREAPSSPSSVRNCSSPPDTPNSPSPQEPKEMDNEHILNELWDEICEDIDMKEETELDCVEFLVEEHLEDPQKYMTPELLQSLGFPTPTNQSQTNSAMNITTNKSVEHSRGTNRTCNSPSCSIATCTNVTVATSNNSSSPVGKQLHTLNPGPPSPLIQGNHMFKAPQTPNTPRRPLPVPQDVVTPRLNMSVSSNHSTNIDHSHHSSVHRSLNNGQHLPQHCYSPRSVESGVSSPQMPHSTTGASGYTKPPPQYGQYQNQHHNIQKSLMTQSHQRQVRTVHPTANLQNMQQPLSTNVTYSQGNMGGQPCSLNNSGNVRNMGFQGKNQIVSSYFSHPIEPPLDQGYLTSSDSISTHNFESGVSTVHLSVSDSIHAMNSQHKKSIAANCQKSVQIAEGTSASCVNQSGDSPYGPFYKTNVPDCELEKYRNNIQKMQSKVMPKLNHHVKSETAPYTVPINNGPTTMNPFEYSNPNNMQPLEYHQKSSSNGFGMDNNKKLVMQNYSETLSGRPNMHSQMHSCNDPMSPVHHSQMDLYGRGQSACRMQDGKSPAMYDPMNMQNNMMKNSCQFVSQSHGNINENCGMMGMNQGMMASGNHISSAQQASIINQNFGNDQNFLNAQPVYQDLRPVKMNMTSASGSRGMIGYDHQFEQNHALSANLDMNNMEKGVYPQNQGANINWARDMPVTPHQHHQMGLASHSNPMVMPGQGMGMDQGKCGQLIGLDCVIPNCANCKNMACPNRPPPTMSALQSIIQVLISDRSNTFRSHPLCPLLKELILMNINFNTPNFQYQFISNLPVDFDKLLHNFIHRSLPSGNNYQTDYAVDSVVMDFLKITHHCLIEKIRQKQEQDTDKQSKSPSKSLSAIEDFCNKFTHQPERKSYIKPATFHSGHETGPGNCTNVPNVMGPIYPPEMATPQKDHNFSTGMSNIVMQGGMFMSPQAKKGLQFGEMMSPGYKGMMDYDSASECGSLVSSSSHPNKPESKKHPSLPKEAVTIMTDWLRQHKDNPYPNDDEKCMLIKQTGLSINQINYWFTNARRRILPKWAQLCKT